MGKASNKNDITGDVIRTKTTGQSTYADNWEKIFGKKKPKDKSKQIPKDYKYKYIEE